VLRAWHDAGMFLHRAVGLFHRPSASQMVYQLCGASHNLHRAVGLFCRPVASQMVYHSTSCVGCPVNLHLAAGLFRRPVASRMVYRRPGMSLSADSASEYATLVTNADVVREIIAQANKGVQAVQGGRERQVTSEVY
jgi:hypothetical protein